MKKTLIIQTIAVFLLFYVNGIQAQNNNDGLKKALELAVTTSNMMQHNLAKEILAHVTDYEFNNMKEVAIIDSTLHLIKTHISDLDNSSETNQKKMDDPKVKENNFLLLTYSTLASGAILTSQAFKAVLNKVEIGRLEHKQDVELLKLLKDELKEMVSKYSEK
jgi:hypothetical protein